MPSRSTDVDLTGGFRLDLKTLGLFVALAASWYNQGGKIDSLREKLEIQEKSRIQIEEARRDTEKAKADALAIQLKQQAEALAKVEQQLKLTAYDVGQLGKDLAAQGFRPQGENR